MAQRQPYTENDESQPLLATNTQPSMENTIEFDQRTSTTAPAAADEHNDDNAESNWVASLQQRPWYNRPSHYWLMPWLVVVGITLSLSSNSIEQLKIRVVCTELLGPQDGVGIPGNLTSIIGHSPALEPVDPCRSSQVLGFVGQLDGNIGAVKGIFTLLTLAKWTSLSDVLGRKFLLHISMFGIAVSFLLSWFAATRFNFLGYHVYYIEAVLLGLIPSGSLVNPAVLAYTVDCTTGNSRSRTIGYLGTSFALGSIIGYAMGGSINLATGDLTVVVKISLVFTALLAIYLSALPESLKTKPTLLSQWIASHGRMDIQTTTDVLSTQAKGATSVVQTLKQAYYLIKANLSTMFDPLLLFVPGHVPKSEKMSTRYTPVLIILANFFMHIGVVGAVGLLIPMTNLVFGWRAPEDGFYSSFKSFCDFITYLAVFPALQMLYKRIVLRPHKGDEEEAVTRPLMQDSSESQESSPNSTESELSSIEAMKMDLVFIVGGLILLVIAHLLVPLIATEFALYFSRALLSLGQTGTVASVSLLSSVMPSHLTGAAIGALSVVDSMGSIIAVFSYGRLFKHTVETSPMLYYYVSAGLCALALSFATVNWWTYRRK